jgi:hypothetical protein
MSVEDALGRLPPEAQMRFDVSVDSWRFIPTPVPEPSTWAMLLLGLGALAASAVRHRRRGAG